MFRIYDRCLHAHRETKNERYLKYQRETGRSSAFLPTTQVFHNRNTFHLSHHYTYKFFFLRKVIWWRDECVHVQHFACEYLKKKFMMMVCELAYCFLGHTISSSPPPYYQNYIWKLFSYICWLYGLDTTGMLDLINTIFSYCQVILIVGLLMWWWYDGRFGYEDEKRWYSHYNRFYRRRKSVLNPFSFVFPISPSFACYWVTTVILCVSSSVCMSLCVI